MHCSDSPMTSVDWTVMTYSTTVHVTEQYRSVLATSGKPEFDCWLSVMEKIRLNNPSTNFSSKLYTVWASLYYSAAERWVRTAYSCKAVTD